MDNIKCYQFLSNLNSELIMNNQNNNMMSESLAFGAAQPQQAFIQQSPALGPDPVGMTCPNCHIRITTLVTNMSTAKTHTMAIVLALLCGFCGCCCIPYCTKCSQAQKHTCPSCKSMIGIYNN
ncbi:hypothetical protein ACKWTF_003407 [Chironomus riparius]